MSFINRCTEKIAKQACLSVVDRELMNYGFKVIYINVSKTLLLFICVMMLNILKEAAILFCAFVCVRLSGFGVHSESTIK